MPTGTTRRTRRFLQTRIPNTRLIGRRQSRLTQRLRLRRLRLIALLQPIMVKPAVVLGMPLT